MTRQELIFRIDKALKDRNVNKHILIECDIDNNDEEIDGYIEKYVNSSVSLCEIVFESVDELINTRLLTEDEDKEFNVLKKSFKSHLLKSNIPIFFTSWLNKLFKIDMPYIRCLISVDEKIANFAVDILNLLRYQV